MKLEELTNVLDFIGATWELYSPGSIYARLGYRKTMFKLLRRGRGATWVATNEADRTFRNWREAPIFCQDYWARHLFYGIVPGLTLTFSVTPAWACPLRAGVWFSCGAIDAVGSPTRITRMDDGYIESDVAVQMYYAIIRAGYTMAHGTPTAVADGLWNPYLDLVCELHPEFDKWLREAGTSLQEVTHET